MAEFDLESIIKSGVEKALNTPVHGGKTISEWAAIGMKNGDGWISVNEQLPDDGDKLPIEAKWVLVWIGTEPFQTYVPLPAKYNWLSKTWTVVGLSDDMNKRVKITHWMPLPEPPKEAEST